MSSPRVKKVASKWRMNILLGDYVTCYLCLKPITVTERGYRKSLTVDHVIPLSKGGTDALHNLQPTHKSCNEQKADKLIFANQQSIRDNAN